MKTRYSSRDSDPFKANLHDLSARLVASYKPSFLEQKIGRDIP